MYPRLYATQTPEKPAIIMARDGAVVTYAALESRANQVAHLLRAMDVAVGDTIAIYMENHALYYPLVWGAQRAGVFFVAISARASVDEVAFILEDCGARLLFTSDALAGTGAQALRQVPSAVTTPIGIFIAKADAHAGKDRRASDDASLEAALDRHPTTPIADERAGIDMLYSSGTTGRPKGIRSALPADPAINAPNILTQLTVALYGFGADMIYLSPAPLYHAAPLRYGMTVHRLGGTVVIMDHFDAEAVLDLITRYRITHAQFVPTHFVRLLKLPDDVRAAADVASLRAVIHAAAPCPIPIKQAMIDWWGPIIFEYYAGSEGNGFVAISTPEWLARPGSVGRALFGTIHICDDDDQQLPPGEEGLVYFESDTQFVYHNDPDATADGRHPLGWTTLGDIGRMDKDGYLTLTDRKSFMIISGGVNIYPREIEDRLITHARVVDVAVIGAPDADLGERVVAVVQLAPDDPARSDDRDGRAAADALRDDLIAQLRAHLSGVKIPRQIDFVDELPRLPTGKLAKRLLRETYG